MKFDVRLLVAVAAAALLSACASVEETPAEPTFYASMAKTEARVDAKAAASMISGYRHNHGLGSVQLDPQLMRAAERQSEAMARNNRFEHDAGGNFRSRINESGFDASVAVENIGAGYHTLAEAFSGWRDSPPHNANMLKAGVTHMGIATAYAPNSKYKVFWTLILAGVDESGNKGGIPVMGAPEPKSKAKSKKKQ